MSKEFNMRTDLLDDPALEEIARQIKEGNTSGHLNNEEGKTSIGNSKLMFGITNSQAIVNAYLSPIGKRTIGRLRKYSI